MSSIDAAGATGAHLARGEQDLGPLAWVLDELRKSLDGAVKAMRRFVRDAEIARESDLASLDAGPLRIARQQLHQASGALEMVGMEPPALVLRAMETAVQRFVQRPELCSDDAAAVIERASFALVEYLEHVLAGKSLSPVALFPQYREVQALAGADRVHPADLWPNERRLRDPQLPSSAAPVRYGAEVRARLDNAVLRVVKNADPVAAADMGALCLGLAAAQQEPPVRAFWKICAGFFEALAGGVLTADVYAKRVASRVLMQYASLAKGDSAIGDRLVQDLLFFCAQAIQPAGAELPTLQAVRDAYGLERHESVDYEQPRFGLFDPAMLAQARKRIAAATDTWSALAGGDRNKLKPAADQLSLVCDSVRKLHPDSESLAQALTRAMETTTQSGEPPSPALAMEVATAILYLQASFEELDSARQHMAERARRLASRLDGVVAGGESQPLEQWMEELYRRVSDHQTMGSVVGELRAALAEAEKAMDQFFRNPDEPTVLTPVPAKLNQMRGVLSVIGLDQASLAVMRMRDTVERLTINDVAPQDRHQVFEKLGNSLGALGFLVDMLSYQRNMARKLFVYDEEQGQLRLLMGRVPAQALEDADVPADVAASPEHSAMAAPEPEPKPATATLADETQPAMLADFDFSLDSVPAAPVGAESLPAMPQAEPEPAVEPSAEAEPIPSLVAAAPAAAMPQDETDDTDDELLQIFLEEAREVVATGMAAIDALHADPGNLSEQTTLRRAFHTLKGSSRMVGLNDYGEAAWSMEQTLNAWLAEQKPIKEPLLNLSGEMLKAFGLWADDIAAGAGGHWEVHPFRVSADAMRLDGTWVPLALSAETPEHAPEPKPLAQVVQEPAQEVAQEAVQETVAETVHPGEPASTPAEPALEPAAGEIESASEAQTTEGAAHLEAPEITSAPDLPGEPELPYGMEDVQQPVAQAADADADATLLFDLVLSESDDEPALDFADTFVSAEQKAQPQEPVDALEEQDLQEVDFALFEEVLEKSARSASQPQAPVADMPEPPPQHEETFFFGAADGKPEFIHDTEEQESAPHAPVLPEPDFAADARLQLDAEWLVQESPLEELPHQEALQQEAQPEELPTEAAALPEAVAGLMSAHDATAAQESAQEEQAGDEPLQEILVEPVSPQEAQELQEAPAMDMQATQAPAEAMPTDEAVKVIEHLRIGLPLYNVYLNEADEWSRRLVTTLQEWSLEQHEPLPDTAVALAHSLAGSSATVGFSALSEMARTLEHTLQHAQLMPHSPPHFAQVFNAAADDIRRLLHQFAAGFLKEPNCQLLEQLQEILHTEVSSEMAPLEGSADARTPSEAADVVTDVDALLDMQQPAEAGLPAFAAQPQGGTAPSPVELQQAAAGEDRDSHVDLAIARAVASTLDMDDDIDAIDVIDPDLFPIFEEEALELLPALGTALRQWSARPDNLSARGELLRTLHTLKGSARLAGAMRLGEMAHRMESAVEQIDKEAATTADIEPLLASLDGLQAGFDALRTIGAQPLTEPVAVSAPAATRPAAQASADSAAAPAAASWAVPAEVPRGRVAAPVTSVPVQLPSAITPLAHQRAAAGQSVRVRAQLLDRLVNQAGEVMIARSRLDARMSQLRASLSDLTGNLERLRQQLRDIELQSESQMQSRLALSKDSVAGFDPLEFDRFTRVQELTRMMAESVNDVATVQRNMQRAMEGAEDDLIAQGRQARELQRDLLRTRMVEFEGISERLYAVVRQASKETGKQIKLDISGGFIEMDRGVLDRMTPAFEHLLRNCVGHGIETPEARASAGKSPVGVITIELRQEGNDVSVEFRDDGAGLDTTRIHAKAVAQGLIAPDAQLSDTQVANLIFMPGFSTASEVTGLSGRGIGMDVVRSEVQALGGRIETRTEAGKGTSFRLVLPLTTAVTQVVMLRAGNLTIGVPASLVEIVRRSSSEQLDAAYASHSFADGGEQLPFYWAGALLQSSACSTEVAGKHRPVVILRSASQRVAIHVDEVLGNQEVVVKNLGPQLSHLPGLAGMSVLASGAVVLIYNPVALATVYGEQVRGATVAPSSGASADTATLAQGGAPAAALVASVAAVPLILVVDDSITVRRVTQRLLQREGYRVALAADGLQALERLQEERPAVVLSDIEMPRMDGFDLARNIRSDAVLHDLPIIMITSRIAQKHREHAMELGVNHYLGKPYSDEELMSLVRHYASLTVDA
ncbi:Hpt domain-containing protein [Diaphorobacter sp.]|uniref:hybrid sensor histidine kinase/response regulator n=1 Tax=Diaphorobacter sp. TaxID=1934310 RepID=UPI003D13BCBB